MVNVELTDVARPPIVTEGERRSLRRLNASMAVVHGVQAVLMIVLSNARSLPVTGAFANGPPGQPERPLEIEQLFSYRLGLGDRSVRDHLRRGPCDRRLAVGPPPVRPRARASPQPVPVDRVLAVSASLMIVIIAGITGITDVAALIALFGVNASMILFGWLMETTNRPGAAGVAGRRSRSGASPASFRGRRSWSTWSAPGRTCRASSTASSCRCSSSSTASRSTSCCSTGPGVDGPTTCSASASTSCSA